MRVGYGTVDITPRAGAPLAGVISRKGRFNRTVRDPLFARAMHVVTPRGELTLVTADILLVTKSLHAEVARRAEVGAESLMISATHTHSGTGGYWDAGRGRLFMGHYDPVQLRDLVDCIVEAIRRARNKPRVARMLTATVTLAGANANRRERFGPIDRELTLLRMDRGTAPPVDVVSFGAHPVIVCEREPELCSADFPGELCARIEKRGALPMFFQGAVGALSPLFPEFPMHVDEHLALVGGLLEQGYEAAVADLVPLDASPMQAHILRIPIDPGCRVFPSQGRRWALADVAALPLRAWMLRMARDADVGHHAPLHVFHLGRATLVGTPCDLGVTVAMAIKRVLRDASAQAVMVGSQCDAYVGYVHLPEDYDRLPDPGFRAMNLYENAMSLSGRHLGRAMVDAMIRDAAFAHGDAD